jgi:hypothetical protein
MTANLQSTDRELWKLIDRVRDAGYGWFTLEEKTRLHNLVVRFKATHKISEDDIEWLHRADENLSGAAALSATFFRRRWKGGAR